MRQCYMCADYIEIGTTCNRCREKQQPPRPKPEPMGALKAMPQPKPGDGEETASLKRDILDAISRTNTK